MASMQITKEGVETAAGPSDWFTGAVYVDTVAATLATAVLGRVTHPGPVNLASGTRTDQWL